MSDANPNGSNPVGPKPVEERFNLTPYSWWLVLIVVLGWWPVVGVYLAGLFADLNGCEVSASGPLPCLAFGRDWGTELYNASGLVGIFGFTMPTALILLIVWATVLGSSFLIWRRRRASVIADPMRVRWLYYAVSLAALLVLAYLTLYGKLPGMVILVVIFGGLFWVSSFIFALFSLFFRRASDR